MKILGKFLLLFVVVCSISTAYGKQNNAKDTKISGDYVADVTAPAANAAKLSEEYAAASGHKTQKIYNKYVPPVATEGLSVIKNTVGEPAKVKQNAAAEAAKLAKEYAAAQKIQEVPNEYDLPIAQTGIKKTQVYNAYIAPTGAKIVKLGAVLALFLFFSLLQFFLS